MFNTEENPNEMTEEEFEIFEEQNEGRWEFVDGKPVDMGFAGNYHSAICVQLTGVLLNYFKGKKCRPRTELEVKLFEDIKDRRRPDLIVICDPSKIKNRICYGAPDLVVEVWSLGNNRNNKERKMEEYIRAGVREIWEIETVLKFIKKSVFSKCVNGHNIYTVNYYYYNDNFESDIFEGLKFNLDKLLEEEKDFLD